MRSDLELGFVNMYLARRHRLSYFDTHDEAERHHWAEKLERSLINTTATSSN